MQDNVNEIKDLKLLEYYKKLLDDKVITEYDYNNKKDEILQSIAYRNIKVNDFWLWLYAIVPIVLRLYANYNKELAYLFIVSWIVECVFLLLDIYEIKKSGKKIGPWVLTGVLINPLYLLIRERQTNRNYSVLIVNILLLILMSIVLFSFSK